MRHHPVRSLLYNPFILRTPDGPAQFPTQPKRQIVLTGEDSKTRLGPVQRFIFEWRDCYEKTSNKVLPCQILATESSHFTDPRGPSAVATLC